MAIDSSVYSNLQLPKFATLGEIAEARAQREDRQAIRESRQLALQQKQREEAEQREVESAFRDLTGPDGPDQKAILARLYKTAPSAASTVEKHFTEMRKNASAEKKAQLEAETARAQAVTRHLQGVTPQTYSAAIARIQRIDPEAAAELGPTFDPAKVDAILNAGLAWSEYNGKYKDALERDDKDTAKVLNVLSIASDPDQWSDGWEMGKVLGVSNELRQMGLSDQFAPDAPTKAAQLTMNAKDRAQLSEQAADNARQDRAQRQTEAYQNAQLGISRGQLAVAQGNLAARKAEAASGTGTGGAKLSAAAVEKVAGAEQALSIIDDIDKMLPRFTPQLGPIAGRVAEAKLTMPGVKVSQGLAEFAAQITTLKNSVIKATTGAAMSEPEAKRIMAQVPDLSNKPSVFKARLETTKRNLEMLRKRTIELSGGTTTGGDSGAVAPPTGRYNPATGRVE